MSNGVTWHPTAYRTHNLGQIQAGEDLVGQTVTVCGFAEALRGKGKICFVDLRDGTGRAQIFFKQDKMDSNKGTLAESNGSSLTISR